MAIEQGVRRAVGGAAVSGAGAERCRAGGRGFGHGHEERWLNSREVRFVDPADWTTFLNDPQEPIATLALDPSQGLIGQQRAQRRAISRWCGAQRRQPCGASVPETLLLGILRTDHDRYTAGDDTQDQEWQ